IMFYNFFSAPSYIFRKTEIRKINKWQKHYSRMVQQIELTKIHRKNNGDPYCNKLTGNRYKLQPEPDSFYITFLHNAPCIIKLHKRLPSINPSLFKHTIHAYMPANSTDNKNDPSHLFQFSGSKNNIILND